MRLTEATPAHADVLSAIHAASFPPREQWGRDAMALQLGLYGTFGLLDPAGGCLLARVVADEAEILTLAVMPELRGQGRGRDLLQAAMARAASRGARAMFLEVSTANAAARHLYGGAGFTEVGRRIGYYPGGVDALVLRRQLSPPGAATDV